MSDRASEALAEAVLPGEPRTYDARSQVSCQKAFLLHIAKGKKGCAAVLRLSEAKSGA